MVFQSHLAVVVGMALVLIVVLAAALMAVGRAVARLGRGGDVDGGEGRDRALPDR